MELVHGNRGKCAQPCRLPYELLKKSSDIKENKIIKCYDDFNQHDIEKFENTEFKKIKNARFNQNIQPESSQTVINKGYLLSPKDLCSLDLLPELVNSGITCFKIEGRLKTPEYVSTVTRIYRKYIDLAQSNKPYIIEENDKKDLLQVFNRGGFSCGYLDEKPNLEFVSKNKPNNMGILLGKVHNFNNSKGYVTLKLQDDISIGDTVSLEKEKGTYTISELMINNQNISKAKKGDIVKIGRIKGNIKLDDKIFKMSSKELSIKSKEFIDNEIIKNKINCKITVHKNTPVSMCIYTGKSDFENIYDNINFTITSDYLIPVDSIKSPITSERIIEQINKLGGTHFEFDKIDVDLDDKLYLPSISKLNQLRRNCIEKLEEIVLNRIHRKPYMCNENNKHLDNSNLKTFVTPAEPVIFETSSMSAPHSIKKFSILLHTLNKKYNYTKLPQVDRIYIPLKYFFVPEFVHTIAQITNTANTYIYMPTILKDFIMKKVSEKLPGILKNYKIKGFVISNISQINLLENCLKNSTTNNNLNEYELIGNYTLNVYNDYTSKQLENLGITSITLSPELDKFTLNSFDNTHQLSENTKTEAIIYGNLPVMTTNYCLISRSNFCLEKCNNNCNNSWNCNLQKNSKIEFFLKDRMNMNFKILPDSFSKTTTIFNSKKNSININEINVDYVRLNFIDENIEEICEIVNVFKNGKILEGKDFTNGNFNRIV